MGLPDEGFGLSKKRFRLGLSSKRKLNHKEACLAEDQSNSVIRSSNDMTATAHHALSLEEGKNPMSTEINVCQHKDPLVPPVASLYNIGNTCYLNCILQTLRYTPGFARNLSQLKESIRKEESRFRIKVPKGKTTQKTSVWKLVECLDDIFRYLRNKENDYTDLCPTDSDTMSIRPDELLCQIRKFNPLFEENSQHDAQELLRCLLSCLDDAESELETSQTQRKQEDEKVIEGLKDNNTSGNIDDENGASVTNTSKLRGRKRKLAALKQEDDNHVSSSIMMEFLGRKKTKSISPTQITCEHKKIVVETSELSDVQNCGDAKNDNVIMKENLVKFKVGTESKLNPAGDGKDFQSLNTLPKEGLNSQEGEKQQRLGTKESKESVEGVIVVSSDEESSDMKDSNHYKNCPESPPKDITEIIEDPIVNPSVHKTNHRSEKGNNKVCSSDTEAFHLSTEQIGNKYMISPGKHLIIHSPLRKGLSPTAQLPHSRSFLTKIQGFLPNSARKILNFSSSQNDSVSAQQGILGTPNISLSQGSCQSNAALDSIGASKLRGINSSTKLTSQCLYEAKLKLKRCDWLGVSPVKSISANLVLERIKNENNTLHQSPSKRKIKFESDEIDGEKYQKDNVECDSSTSENKKRQTTLNFGTMKQHLERNATHLKNSGRKTSGIKSLKQSSEYQGCKIKPLSIQLKKLDWLGTDCKGQSFNLKEILKKEKIADGCQNLRDNTKADKPRQKLVQGLFGGVMGHRTSCCECEKASNRSENFLDVSIPVRILSSYDNNESSDEDEDSKDKGTDSCVFKLLKSLSTRERLCKDNKYFCDQCFALVEAERFCFFQDLPKVLAVHLNRFDAGLGSLTGYVSKISDHVSVPQHLPCLLPKCKGFDCEHRYSLYAVVTHSGSSILRGHYRSYVKVTSSFNKQLYSYMNEEDTNSHHPGLSPPSSPTTFPQSSLPILNGSPDIANNNNTSSATTSLVGDTVEDIANNSFMYNSKQPDKKYEASEELASMASKCGQNALVTGMEEDGERRNEKAWWLECDDESIRVFEEEEFLDRMLEDKSAALLGTPYILFYHQNDISLW